MTCNKRGDEICNRHNNLVQCWTSLLKKASINTTYSTERLLISLGVIAQNDCGKRIDIVESSSSDKTIFADATVTHATPLNPANLKKYAGTDGIAAKDAETRKRNVYGDAAKEVDAVFVPLSVESYGRWGSSAIEFSRGRIKNFARTVELGGEVDRGLLAKLQNYWWSRLSCCLQKGNVSVVYRRYFKALEARYGNKLEKGFDLKQLFG